MYKNHDTHDDGTYRISLTFCLPLNNTNTCKLTQHIHRVYFLCVSGHDEVYVFSNSVPVYSINLQVRHLCPTHWTTRRKPVKSGTLQDRPTRKKQPKAVHPAPEHQTSRHNTPKGPARNSADTQCFLLCLFSFFSDAYNPTVNLSYFNQLHKTLNPVNNEISLKNTNMQYPLSKHMLYVFSSPQLIVDNILT